MKVVREGKEIPVHQYILASRSPVFQANFVHAENQEGNAGKIIIEDFDFETMLALVRYVYPGFRSPLGFFESLQGFRQIFEKGNLECPLPPPLTVSGNT